MFICEHGSLHLDAVISGGIPVTLNKNGKQCQAARNHHKQQGQRVQNRC